MEYADDAQPSQPVELLREFLGARTATELAEHIGVARATISRIPRAFSEIV
jgi:plasmid maintenance system antidote protein VapI